MLALRAEPEAEHDRDVGEERERVPVIDRLVEARDALVLRASAGTAFVTSAHASVVPMTRESIAAARRAACARPTAASTSPSPRNAAYATLLLNASQLRSPTIDHQTVTPVQVTRRTSDQTSTAPERPSLRRREPPERNGEERSDEHEEGGPAHRQRPADARSVAGEHRAEQCRTDEGGENASPSPGRALGRLRRRVHGGPR